MDELAKLVEESRETRGVELKRTMNWSEAATQGKVIRTALALSNHRDGGLLLLGFEEYEDGSHSFVGVSDEDSASFDPDAVVSTINKYATPHVRVEVVRRTIDDKHVVAIVVQQFHDAPTICSRDLTIDDKPVLRASRIYCRSRRMPETTEVTSPDDLREILDLAVETALARYAALRRVEGEASKQTDGDQFAAQIEDLA